MVSLGGTRERHMPVRQLNTRNDNDESRNVRSQVWRLEQLFDRLIVVALLIKSMSTQIEFRYVCQRTLIPALDDFPNTDLRLER